MGVSLSLGETMLARRNANAVRLIRPLTLGHFRFGTCGAGLALQGGAKGARAQILWAPCVNLFLASVVQGSFEDESTGWFSADGVAGIHLNGRDTAVVREC
jgi:hypothetical protein